MINYNLREYGYKNHPLEYKWGFYFRIICMRIIYAL